LTLVYSSITSCSKKLSFLEEKFSFKMCNRQKSFLNPNALLQIATFAIAVARCVVGVMYSSHVAG